jgi:hypothetical protein
MNLQCPTCGWSGTEDQLIPTSGPGAGICPQCSTAITRLAVAVKTTPEATPVTEESLRRILREELKNALGSTPS